MPVHWLYHYSLQLTSCNPEPPLLGDCHISTITNSTLLLAASFSGGLLSTLTLKYLIYNPSLVLPSNALPSAPLNTAYCLDHDAIQENAGQELRLKQWNQKGQTNLQVTDKKEQDSPHKEADSGRLFLLH